jgi:hypothetical protein
LGLSWVAPALAGTLKVPEEFESVGWALEYAYDGDTIEVNGELYDGEPTIFVYNIEIRIKGSSGVRPVLPAIVGTYSRLELENLDVGGEPFYDDYSGAVARLLLSDGSLDLKDVAIRPIEGSGTGEYAYGIYADFLDTQGFRAENLTMAGWGYGTALAVYDSAGEVAIDQSVISSSQDQGLVFQEVGAVHISSSTFTNNKNTALYFVDSGSLQVDGNTVFQDNQGDYGADIVVSWSSGDYAEWSDLGIADTTFTGSSARVNGGSIYTAYTDVTMSQVDFTDVSAVSGGALAIFGTSDADASLDLSHVTVDGGDVLSSGAGIVGTYVDAVIVDSQFDNLDVKTGGDGSVGGGIALWEAVLDLERVSFTNASADYGGGYYLNGGTLTAVDVDIAQTTNDHMPVSGGGAYLIETTGTYADGSFDGLVSSSGGSALVFVNSNMTFAGTTFDNLTTSGSGAIAGVTGVLTIDDVQMTDVSAASGAAITLNDVTATITGLAVSRASVTGSAAGIFAQDSDTLLIGSSVMDSSANQATAGLFYGGKVAIQDSTFKRNTADTVSSGLGMQGMESIEVQTSLFCNNGGAGYDLITVIGTTELASIHNNIFHMNKGPGADVRLVPYEGYPVLVPLSIVNNTFVDSEQGLGGVAVQTGSAAITNNILQGGMVGVSTNGAEVTGGYNLYFGNAQDTVGDDFGVGEDDVSEDAMFVNETGDCFSDLHLQPDSPARGAGDPSQYGDGLGWDLGRWTGPPVDVDQDGYTSDIDCDDDDPDRHPGAVEHHGDGIDQDCDGLDVSLFVTGGGGGCGCSSSPMSAGWLLGLMPLMLLRRRA